MYTRNLTERQRRIKAKGSKVKLNVKEFQLLNDLLYETLKGNSAACARVLDIDSRVYKSWPKNPPTWPWWNIVLRAAIKTVLANMTAKKGLSKEHTDKMKRLFDKIKDYDHTLEIEIADLSYQLGGAEEHLRRKLSTGPMKRKKLFKAGNMGGYSRSAIETAARTLQVVKDTKGFGKDKKTTWRLPTADEWDTEFQQTGDE